MSIVDDIVTALEADSGAGGVATLLTGGIYTYEETGRLGLNMTSTPSAFNSTTGVLKPCVVVKSRSAAHDNAILDDAAQDISYSENVELWFYTDGDSTTSAIQAAAARAIVVLHGKPTGSSGLIPRFTGTAIKGMRAQELDNAHMRRDDYNVRGIA